MEVTAELGEVMGGTASTQDAHRNQDRPRESIDGCEPINSQAFIQVPTLPSKGLSYIWHLHLRSA